MDDYEYDDLAKERKIYVILAQTLARVAGGNLGSKVYISPSKRNLKKSTLTYQNWTPQIDPMTSTQSHCVSPAPKHPILKKIKKIVKPWM